MDYPIVYDLRVKKSLIDDVKEVLFIEKDANICFSPHLMILALTSIQLTNQYIRFKNYKEFINIFHTLSKRREIMNIASKLKNVKINLLNRMYMPTHVDINERFVKKLQMIGLNNFIVEMDYSPEKTILQINKWISTETGDHNSNFLKKNSILHTTQVVSFHLFNFQHIFTDTIEFSRDIFHPYDQRLYGVDYFSTVSKVQYLRYFDSDLVRIRLENNIYMMILLPHVFVKDYQLDIKNLRYFKKYFRSETIQIVLPVIDLIYSLPIQEIIRKNLTESMHFWATPINKLNENEETLHLSNFTISSKFSISAKLTQKKTKFTHLRKMVVNRPFFIVIYYQDDPLLISYINKP
ncbi:hypothetical protein A3Q56_00374 [Intoshia linei]|uniref:Serpin domain-containing protein n=1 Tax=Intoshia linei TaxID=1819745 RepID=A0A177BE11_9BILA|nr:hypothetical protein A3Q56_00374 [Intoshia linei]